MRLSKNKNQAGFTLVELLVVISIIGLISSIAVTSLSSARASARDGARKATLRQLQTALELYFQDNDQYPYPGFTAWRSSEPDDVILYSADYIPGLAPTYVAQLPRDPLGQNVICASTWKAAYLYISDGDNYKLLSHCSIEGDRDAAGFPDPRRDGTVNCTIDSPTQYAWAVTSDASAACANDW